MIGMSGVLPHNTKIWEFNYPLLRYMSSPSLSGTAATPPATESFGVIDAQKDDAYDQWLRAGLQGGLSATTQYQWPQSNLTEGPQVAAPTSTNTVTGTGEHPNDGYSTRGQGQAEAVGVLSEAAQSFGADAT